MIEELKCDIFDAPIDVMVHCANCFHVMGGGIAKSVKQYYPEAFAADLRTGKGDKSKLGSVSVGIIKGNLKARRNLRLRHILNLYGQFNYGAGVVNIDYDALREGFYKTLDFCYHNKLVLGIPKYIGCGLSGGDWDGVVYPMIQEIFKDVSIIICEL